MESLLVHYLETRFQLPFINKNILILLRGLINLNRCTTFCLCFFACNEYLFSWRIEETGLDDGASHQKSWRLSLADKRNTFKIKLGISMTSKSLKKQFVYRFPLTLVNRWIYNTNRLVREYCHCKWLPLTVKIE